MLKVFNDMLKKPLIACNTFFDAEILQSIAHGNRFFVSKIVWVATGKECQDEPLLININ